MEAVLRRITAYYGDRLQSLLVFGSYACGRPRFHSDLDLLIVLSGGCWTRLSERNEEFVLHVEQYCDEPLQALHEAGVSMELSPLILLRDEASGFLPIYLDLVEHHWVVEDREGFMRGVLERVRGQMARWGSRRMDAGGHWLWEIRPGTRWGEKIRYDE